jgi:aspartyl-tRNA(Asn)/glutamyl-tRNA(Gln) amidotransferase subunit A
MSDDFIKLSISQVSEKIMNMEVSPLELVESCLTEIERINQKINAFVTVDNREVIKAAKIATKEIKSGNYRGPLHGIPIGVKDIIDTKGIRTTNGSAIFEKHIPQVDATVINRLKKAGAIIIGKTNTHEFAFGVTTNNPHYGSTKNPWNVKLIPGGSSGGSAAATAANLCYGALGSDTGGSIRIPAAFCGTVGLKPTYGRVSLYGVFPLATTFDHVGPITKTVEDAAILLNDIAGFDERDPNTLRDTSQDYASNLQENSVEGTKVGITQETHSSSLDPEIRNSFNEAVATLEKLGVEINEVKIISNEEIRKAAILILSSEAALEHRNLLEEHGEKYGPDVLERLRTGQEFSLEQYINALRGRQKIIREMELLFDEIDFLITPSVQIKAPRIGEKTVLLDKTEINIINGCTRFTRLANITGYPAIVIPSGYSSDSLPLSIQLMAKKTGDKDLIQIAHAYEKATPNLRSRKPHL